MVRDEDDLDRKRLEILRTATNPAEHLIWTCAVHWLREITVADIDRDETGQPKPDLFTSISYVRSRINSGNQALGALEVLTILAGYLAEDIEPEIARALLWAEEHREFLFALMLRLVEQKR